VSDLRPIGPLVCFIVLDHGYTILKIKRAKKNETIEGYIDVRLTELSLPVTYMSSGGIDKIIIRAVACDKKDAIPVNIYTMRQDALHINREDCIKLCDLKLEENGFVQ